MKKDQQPSASKQNKKDGPQPDPETLGTTDPQEHMEGPVSSLVQKVKDKVDENNAESPEDADKGKK